MNKAEQYEEDQSVPPGLQDAADEVLNQIEESYNAPNLVEPEFVENLANKQEWHGFHAYRYEILDDDSVVALYAMKPGELKVKAFADMAEASKWSPRSERPTA